MKTLLLLTPFLLGNSAGGLGFIMAIYGVGLIAAILLVVTVVWLVYKFIKSR